MDAGRLISHDLTIYDEEAIYFGVVATDPEPSRIVVTDLKKDYAVDGSDAFVILLDTFHDGRSGYQFATNPAGAKWDAQLANEGRDFNVNWDGIWSVEARVTEIGWVAEIVIPFRTLKFADRDPQTWGQHERVPERARPIQHRYPSAQLERAVQHHPPAAERLLLRLQRAERRADTPPAGSRAHCKVHIHARPLRDTSHIGTCPRLGDVSFPLGAWRYLKVAAPGNPVASASRARLSTSPTIALPSMTQVG